MTQWDSIGNWDQTQDLVSVKKDTNDSGVEILEDKLYKCNSKKTYKVICKVNEIGMPEKGEQLRLITFRSFNAVLFLEHIAKKEKIKDLKIVVYSINHIAAQLIVDLIDRGRICKMEILISNLRNKAHREKEQLTKDMFVNHKKISLFFASSHAKIISMATEQDNYYTIEGSGNLSFNSRIEQYSIENNKELYLFNCNWLNEIKTFLKNKKELIII